MFQLHPAITSQEWNAPCNQLIVDNFQWYKQCTGTACHAPCIFGNLEDCIPKGTYHQKDPFWWKFYKVDSAVLYKTQHCNTHNRECLLFPQHSGEKSDIETAGLPCWDMSLAGKRLQENGRTVGTFLCHAKRHIELMTPNIILENTKDRAIGTNQCLINFSICSMFFMH